MTYIFGLYLDKARPIQATVDKAVSKIMRVHVCLMRFNIKPLAVHLRKMIHDIMAYEYDARADFKSRFHSVLTSLSHPKTLILFMSTEKYSEVGNLSRRNCRAFYMVFNEMNSRGQVDLIDMQMHADSHLKWYFKTKLQTVCPSATTINNGRRSC